MHQLQMTDPNDHCSRSRAATPPPPLPIPIQQLDGMPLWQILCYRYHHHLCLHPEQEPDKKVVLLDPYMIYLEGLQILHLKGFTMAILHIGRDKPIILLIGRPIFLHSRSSKPNYSESRNCSEMLLQLHYKKRCKEKRLRPESNWN